MQAQAMLADPNPPAGTVQEPFGIEIDAVSRALRLTRPEGQEIARYLEELGWVMISSPDSKPHLRLTLKGIQDIASLHRPAWRKWVEAHPLILAAISSIVTGVVVVLIQKLIEAIWR